MQQHTAKSRIPARLKAKAEEKPAELSLERLIRTRFVVISWIFCLSHPVLLQFAQTRLPTLTTPDANRAVEPRHRR